MPLNTVPPKIWKRTPRMITLEHFDTIASEIQENTSWSKEAIKEKLYSEKSLICLQDARYHIYRDSLG